MLGRVNAFTRLFSELSPWLDSEHFDCDALINQNYRELTAGKIKPADLLLDLITEENICHLRGADVEFLDRKALRTMLRELLINESYYFECESDAPLIYDCGANIGLAIYYYKTLYPNARVVAFEPWAPAYECARRNIERNGWSDVAIYPVALYDFDGMLALNVPEDNSIGATLTSRCREGSDAPVSETAVECRRLSGYMTGEPVEFLKLDVEGVEKKVLFELGDQLQNVKRLFCEYHYGKTVEDNSLAEILTLLERRGFTCSVNYSAAFHGRMIRPFRRAGEKISMEIIAVRP